MGIHGLPGAHSSLLLMLDLGLCSCCLRQRLDNIFSSIVLFLRMRHSFWVAHILISGFYPHDIVTKLTEFATL